MAGAVVSFSSMAVAGREVSFELDTFETMTYRSVIGLAIICTVLVLTGRTGEVRSRYLPMHALRNVFHFTGQNLWFFALTAIPLAQVFALEFTSPIWVVLLAPLFLSERLTRRRIAVALAGFVGILIVARPDPQQIDPGILAAVTAAMGFAGTAVMTKLLTRRDTTLCILFWLTAMQTVFGVVCAGIDGNIALPSPTTLPLLIIIGCAGLAAHFCLTTALGIAPATIVMPMDFARLPVIAIVGMILYDEPLDIMVLIGAVIIFGSNYLNLRAESRMQPVRESRDATTP
ncbi:DMT family transporter [Mesobaculum littorinae]|uniref:DMT family transporter n=2 Tax=Mesobaculum littorinae TaxID=2486419 RepID=A0A438AMX5_9RHOB|nr:DMT family transporter [Mesobaculum littorinae]RVW00033.1 DMT family transporter [Mesobaculum littorinae]